MCHMIIFKITKKQGCTLSLEYIVFEKPQGMVKLTTPVVLGLKGVEVIIFIISLHYTKTNQNILCTLLLL